MSEILDNSYFKNTRKEKYSFPKTDRFPELKPQYTIDYYDKSLNKQRSTSFGYGSKYDFFKETSRDKRPSPFQYSVNSPNITRGLSFGLGRNDVKSNSYIDAQKLKGPCVGKYNTNNTNPQLKLKKRAPSCVMVSKHPEDSFIKGNTNPDPGNYNPIDTFYSRRKRSANFAFGSAKRFEYDNRHISKVIGPGSYTISPKNQARGSFAHSTRKTYAVQEIQKSISPGPKYFIP